MGQSATTLMSMIAASHGSCSSQVTYYRSYYLYYPTEGEVNMRDIVLRLRPDILILTVGGHLQDMGDIYDVWGIIMPIIKAIRKHLPHIQLMWKSSNPADDHCLAMNKPLLNYPRIQDISTKSQYNQHLFRRYDTISRKFSRKLNISYIDMSPLYMRGDAHVGHFKFKGDAALFYIIVFSSSTASCFSAYDDAAYCFYGKVPIVSMMSI